MFDKVLNTPLMKGEKLITLKIFQNAQVKLNGGIYF